jgi:hypothetical protein
VTSAIPQAPGVCDGQNGVDFVGFSGARPTTTVKLLANQTITASSTLSIGSAALPVTHLSLSLCYQDTAPGSTISAAAPDPNFFGFPPNGWLSLPPNTNMPFSITRSFVGLTPATYEIGLCGCIDGTDAWVTDWAFLSVQVFQQ